MVKSRQRNWAFVNDSSRTPLELKFQDWRCRLVMEQYSDGGGPSLRLVDADDGSSIARVTSKLSEFNPQEDELLIKNYSENEGVLAALVDAGVLTDTGVTVRTEFAELSIARLIPHVAEQWNVFRRNLAFDPNRKRS
jgi:hypothetical protein